MVYGVKRRWTNHPGAPRSEREHALWKMAHFSRVLIPDTRPWPAARDPSPLCQLHISRALAATSGILLVLVALGSIVGSCIVQR